MSDGRASAQIAVNILESTKWRLIISLHGAKAARLSPKTAKCYVVIAIAEKAISSLHQFFAKLMSVRLTVRRAKLVHQKMSHPVITRKSQIPSIPERLIKSKLVQI